MIWQSFDGVTPPYNIHQRYSWNLAYPPAELAITSGDDEATISSDSLHKTIVGVGPVVGARKALKAGITGYTWGE